eukprot:CAMPEP_0198704486 /NCGR_PEP_ID=MMETSP1468-20131203/389928_1 /TAXON_ID=1461545 /ORGANISM="Mantoniella sp, Strain CCMP1436" /LENGTH=83 /DNA_ID=CAMNT_0044463303 /DNA_START=2183 /DNA_END=2430 /DNA_ORIENTATION=+
MMGMSTPSYPSAGMLTSLSGFGLPGARPGGVGLPSVEAMAVTCVPLLPHSSARCRRRALAAERRELLALRMLPTGEEKQVEAG